MQHIEGIIKTVELVGKENGSSHIYIEFRPYGESLLQKIAIDAEHLIKKLLQNEKIGMITWDSENEDVVNIRGVSKDLPLIATYH